MAQTLINGYSYGWSTLEINIGRVPVFGVTAISYNEEEEMEENYGKGNRPVSRGFGNITTTGSITLDMAEVEALQAASPTGRLQDLNEFDVIVSYQPKSGAIKTHKLKNCRFKNNGREINQNDKRVSTQLELIIAEIIWNA